MGREERSGGVFLALVGGGALRLGVVGRGCGGGGGRRMRGGVARGGR